MPTLFSFLHRLSHKSTPPSRSIKSPDYDDANELTTHIIPQLSGVYRQFQFHTLLGLAAKSYEKVPLTSRLTTLNAHLTAPLAHHSFPQPTLITLPQHPTPSSLSLQIILKSPFLLLHTSKGCPQYAVFSTGRRPPGCKA